MNNSVEEIGSLLGEGASFKGKLTFLGTVRIEGDFEGEIFADATLVVAKGGNVKGKISVRNLVITGGIVDGTVEAKESVELLKDGQLFGEVITPAFEIEKGAVFKGVSNMVSDSSSNDVSENATGDVE